MSTVNNIQAIYMLLWFFGLVITLIFSQMGDHRLVKFSLPAFKRFGLLLLIGHGLGLITDIILTLFYYYSQTPQLAIPFDGITTFFVYWEDAFYTIPLLIASHVLKLPKKLFYPLCLLSCISFASGHISYSYFWAAITLLYVPISYKMSIKHGVITVMACHIMYDLAVTFRHVLYDISLLIIGYFI